MEVRKNYYHSPLGIIEIIGNKNGILALDFLEEKPFSSQLDPDYQKEVASGTTCGCLVECYQQLEEYFQGQRQHFTVPIIMVGTPFQKRVWESLQQIPYGETASYKEIAISIGNTNASRGVGSACRLNKLAIIIPCHRVIGSNGQLTGYAGGLWRKQYLLKLEQKYYSHCLHH